MFVQIPEALHVRGLCSRRVALDEELSAQTDCPAFSDVFQLAGVAKHGLSVVCDLAQGFDYSPPYSEVKQAASATLMDARVRADPFRV